MRRQKPRNRKLSIYLMKDEYQDFESLVKRGADEYQVKRDDRTVGTLYIKRMHGYCPAWFSLFDGSVPEKLREKLSSHNVSAVFLIRREGRIFAITFGYGRSLLEPGTWEERFGLKVVLNSIDREKIRVIDRKNIDTMLTHTRTQTSKTCAIEEFNLDMQQILLKAVTGEPREKDFASCISGADALSITCQATLDTIDGKCDELLKAFTARGYETWFPGVNNISEVTSKQEVEGLNEELVRRIKSTKIERLFLAVPDIIEWTDIDGFKFRENDDEVHPDIFLPNFLETVRNLEDLSCQYLKQRRIFQVRTETGVTEPKWSVFHCLNCEVAGDGKTYILTEGKWYEINASFVAQVNERIRTIDKYSIPLSAGESEKELDYCRRLYESDKARYALMDRKTIRHGGGYSQMEFCDLFTKDGKLIHLKRYAGSSVLSHLFTQGTNCARAFLADAEFRGKVNAKLPTSHRFDATQQPVPRNYEIVFGIISETADDLPDKLPFFSKITLMRALQELRDIMGYRTSLAGIRVA